MRPDELRGMLQGRPFTPFRLHLTDGSHFDVRHPELVLVGERSAIVGHTSEPNKTFYERYSTVVLFHIVRVEPLEVPAGSNGE